MFAPIVKAKTHIALLLVSIFLAKFVAIDADGLNALFSGNDIAFVNQYCKTENFPKQSNKTADYSEADLFASQIIALNGFCTSQFQFEFHAWETSVSEATVIFNEHFTSRLSYLYLDNTSPPPRLT